MGYGQLSPGEAWRLHLGGGREQFRPRTAPATRGGDKANKPVALEFHYRCGEPVLPTPPVCELAGLFHGQPRARETSGSQLVT